MARCRLCGRSGWFLHTQPNGVCAKCDSAVRDEISSLRRILDGWRGVEARNPDVAVRECDAIIERLARLERYEGLGILPAILKPSVSLKEMEKTRQGLLQLIKDQPQKEGMKCKLCGEPGWITANGLCLKCEPAFLLSLKSHNRVMQECLRLIRESKRLDIRLRRCDIFIENVRHLLKHEELGIPTTNPLPSELIKQMQNKRKEIIESQEQPFSKGESPAAGMGVGFDLRDENTETYLINHAGERTWPGVLDAETQGKLRIIFRRVLDEKKGARGIAVGLQQAFPTLSPSQAEMIANDELGLALNYGSCKGYLEGGVNAVMISDGGQCCEACETVDGMIISTRTAIKHLLQHTGCVRAFMPMTETEQDELEDSDFLKAVGRPKYATANDGRKILKEPAGAR